MDLVINFTPTGMIPTKEMTPFVPITVSEIVEDVHKAVEIGITMVHLHARDEATKKPTYKAEIYSRIIKGIRSYDLLKRIHGISEANGRTVMSATNFRKLLRLQPGFGEYGRSYDG